MSKKLNAGDSFPTLTLSLVSGGVQTLPDQLHASYNVILFYRGHW